MALDPTTISLSSAGAILLFSIIVILARDLLLMGGEALVDFIADLMEGLF